MVCIYSAGALLSNSAMNVESVAGSLFSLSLYYHCSSWGINEKWEKIKVQKIQKMPLDVFGRASCSRGRRDE